MITQQFVRDLTRHAANGRSPDDDADQLAEILADYMERLERGEPSNAEAILAAHPELADELRDNFAKLAALHRAAVGMTDGGETLDQLCLSSLNQPLALGDFRLVRPIGRGGMGVVYEAEQISLHRRVALKTLPLAAVLDPKQLARFQNEAQAAASLDHPHIVSVYAVGADRGVHYYAMRFIEGLSLAEVVEGLKPRSHEHGAAGDETPAASRAATHVDTDVTVPDTLPAVPADAIETLPYGADAWPPAHSVEGKASETQRGLDATLSTFPAFSSREYFRNIAQLGIQAAEALHYAHEMGVVHRDVKPSNLLLDNDGRLYVTDFGLAMTQSDSNLTMSGDLLGTLRYMSPEQASGRRALVDRRTDIYSLGASLYELATLRPAYPDEDRTRLLQQIISEPPQLPSRINRSLPADLETIVLKAMAKEPTDRYATAQDLADDLSRFVKHEPIRARRISQFERLRSWCRRNKLVAGLLTAVAALLLAFAVGGPLAAVNQARLKWQAQEELSAKNINQLYQDWYSGNAQRVADELAQHDATADPAEFHFEWELLRRIYADSRKTIIFERQGERDFPKFVAFSPDGRWLACGQPGDRVAIYDMQRKTFRQLDIESPVNVAGVAFSPDGQELITVSWAGIVKRRDVETCRLTGPVISCRPEGDTGSGDVVTWWNRFRLSPDGRTAAVGMANGERVLAQLEDGHTSRIAAHEGEVGAIAFSPDGSQLVTSGADRKIKVWDLQSHEMIRMLNVGWRINDAQIVSDGSRLVVGGYTHGVCVFDMATFGPHYPLRTEPTAVLDLAMYGDDILATTADDGSIALWDLHSGRRLANLVGHTDTVRNTAFSPDGKYLVSAGRDGTIRVWRIDQTIREAKERLAGTLGWTTDLHFVDEGRRLVSCTRPSAAPIGASAATYVQRWDVSSGACETVVEQGEFGRSDLEPVPGTKHFLCGGPGKLSLVDIASGKHVEVLDEDPMHEYQQVAVSSDGRLVAGAGHLLEHARETDYFALKPRGDTCFVAIHNLDTHQHEFFRLPTSESDTWVVNRIVFSRDGKTLVVGGGDGTALYRTDTFQFNGEQFQHVGIREIPRGGDSAEVVDVAFSADGRFVGAATSHGFGRFWVLDGTQQETQIRRKLNTYALAFSPDGRILALGDASSIQLCELPSQHPLAIISIGSRVCDLQFSPDGRTLAWAAADGRVDFLRTTVTELSDSAVVDSGKSQGN